jgi:hypothetical protein
LDLIEIEWSANLSNRTPDRVRAYEKTIADFLRFTRVARPEEFRT